MAYVGAPLVKADFSSEITVSGDVTVDTNVLVVDTTNNRVGIGTSSPSTELHVKGDIDVEGDTGGVAVLRFKAEEIHGTVEGINIGINFGGLAFKTNANGTTAERMRIDSYGNVGIGTSSPSEKIHVKRSGATGVYLRFEDSTGSAYAGTDSGHLQFFSGGATERMRITSGGNVGIGTTSPSRKLSVDKGTGAGYVAEFKGTNTLSVYDSATDGIGIGSGAGDSLRLFAGDVLANGMTIATSGNVGIGTTSPQAELHLKDTGGLSRIRFEGTASGADNFEIGQGTTGVTNANFEIRDIDASATRLVIDSSGNVGIGATSPSHMLHAKTTGTDYIFAESSGSANNTGFRFKNGDTDWYLLNNSNGDLQYYNGTQATTPFHITADTGNVGIGTSSPARQVHLHDSSGDNNLHITNSTTGSTASDGFSIVSQSGTNDVLLNQRESSSMRFLTGNSERMRIDSSGKMIIGGTTHDYSGNHGIQIDAPSGNNANIIFRTSGDSETFAVGADANLDAGVLNVLSNDPMIFKTNDTERMRITSVGNVGIGTTGPSSDAIVRFLHINDGTSAGLVLDGPEKFSIYSSSSSALVFRNEDTDTSPLAIYDNDRIGYKSEGSNNIRSATDLRQGSAKQWGNWEGIGSYSVQDSYNTTSIADIGVGTTRITLNNDMNNTGYCQNPGGADGPSTGNYGRGMTIRTNYKYTTRYDVVTTNLWDPSSVDLDNCSSSILGDLA